MIKKPLFFLPLTIGLRFREGPLHLDPRRAAFSSTGEVAGSESGAGGGNGGYQFFMEFWISRRVSSITLPWFNPAEACWFVVEFNPSEACEFLGLVTGWGGL